MSIRTSGTGWVPFFLMCLAVGCTDSDSTGAISPGYAEEIRPILNENCVSCHQAGSIAPFSLDTFENAAPNAAAVADAARARRMPPYPMDNSGECSTFKDARWLSESDIETLEEWAAVGAPAGDLSIEAPPTREFPELTGDVRRIEMPQEYTPATDRPDDYRCFIVDAPQAEDYAVTGFDMRPGNPAIAHHAILYSPRTEAALAEALQLDAEEEGPGYTCFGAAGSSRTVAAWAPGGGATRFPAGTGITLAGGRPLILQMHYHTFAGSGADRTAVDLQLAASAVVPARFIPLADLSLELPPHSASVTESAALRIADYTNLKSDLRIFGLFPHMHTLGRTLRVEVERPDGSKTCVAEVPRWDFDWQLLYFHETPIAVDAADSLRITCTFNTLSRDSVVRWGEGTEDEMCIAGLYVSL